MGDKSANIDSTYVENSLSFPVIADKTNEDSSSSDDDDEKAVGKPQSKNLSLDLQHLVIIVSLLALKKRHEYPTTMDKNKKKAAFIVDLNALKVSDVHLEERQYIALAKKVATAALSMPSQANSISTYNSNDMDLKKMFGLTNAKMCKVDMDTMNCAKASIAADLFRLGAETARPNTEGKAGMTQAELMEFKKQETAAAAEEKKRTGDEALKASTNGTGRKRAKVIRGGSNDSALQRSSVPFISAENNNTCTIGTPSVNTVASLSIQAKEILASIQENLNKGSNFELLSPVARMPALACIGCC